MVEINVKAYTYDELAEFEYSDAIEEADYDIECLVCEVYDYNMKLLKEKHLSKNSQKVEALRKKCEEANKGIKERFESLKEEFDRTGKLSSHSLVELLHEVVTKEVYGDDLNAEVETFNYDEVKQNLMFRHPWREVASKFCERSGIYFTANGSAIFSGKNDYKIILE